jgi:hypothetical protein
MVPVGFVRAGRRRYRLTQSFFFALKRREDPRSSAEIEVSGFNMLCAVVREIKALSAIGANFGRLNGSRHSFTSN